METPGILVLLWLCVMPSLCDARTYYVAAVEQYWNYMSGEHVTSGSHRKPTADKYTFKKAIYKEYTDATFTKEKPKPRWLGITGPIIYGERGDVVRIVFFNNASQVYAMHPHGVLYHKISEGALYNDGFHIIPNTSHSAPDIVQPGHVHTYEWVPSSDNTPTATGPDCLTWLYHSHVNTNKDTNSGLVGFMLTCKQGMGKIALERRHFALYITTFDETQSWYVNENLPPGRDTGSRPTSFYAINGYIYRRLPDLEACVGEKVTWFMAGLGHNSDIHSISISGQTFEEFHHRQSSISVNTAQFVTATSMSSFPGRWLMTCRVYRYAKGGMQAYYNVKTCSNVKLQKSKINNMRRYIIAVEEVFWNYGPMGVDGMTARPLEEPGSNSELYFKRNDTLIGGTYKKAVFRAYADNTFLTRTIEGDGAKHHGMLGPVIRAEVGDLVQIIFKNMASRPYSLHGEGVVYSKKNEGKEYQDYSSDKSDDSVAPGQIRTYYWMITDFIGPTDEDPQCITRAYVSGVDVIRDTYSGLIGPLLICKKGSLTRDGKQRGIDHEFILVPFIVDENRSWYLSDNIRKAGLDKDIMESEMFQSSNMRSSMNGLMFGNVDGLRMCRGSNVSWHVLAMGSTSDRHSLYFHGNAFSFLHSRPSTAKLLPGMRKTLCMTPLNLGSWQLSCMVYPHFTSGEISLYHVDPCSTKVKEEETRMERTFYLQAEEIDWDYAPTGLDQIFARALPDSFKWRRFRKIIFRGYTDETFSTPINEPGKDYLGFVGPILRVESNDILRIVFRNKASRPLSIHPQGLTYIGQKRSKGSVKNDQPSVESGKTFTYKWKVPEAVGPGQNDLNCVNYPYYSDVDIFRDTNTGLAGTFVVCRPGTLGENGMRNDIQKDFVGYFMVIDESASWFADQNQAKCEEERRHNLQLYNVSCQPSVYFVVNGYIFGNQPYPVMKQFDQVEWYLIGMGDTLELHPIHFHGNTFQFFDGTVHAADVSEIIPGYCSTVHMYAVNAGTWLYHCHANPHLVNGMESRYRVEPWNKTDVQSSQKLIH